MKRIMTLLLSLLLAAALSVTAFAQQNTVTVSTTVPQTHQVTVAAQSGGQILSQDLGAGDSLEVERQKEQVYHIVPDRGQRLARLLYNGVDVTDQVVNNTFTAPPLQGDASLEAFFEKDPYYHWYDDSDDDDDDWDDDDDDDRSGKRDKQKGASASTGKNDRGGKGGSSSQSSGKSSPETGDPNHPTLWLALLLLSGGGLLSGALWGRRKRRSAHQ